MGPDHPPDTAADTATNPSTTPDSASPAPTSNGAPPMPSPPESPSGVDLQEQGMDGPPDDKEAFFGHPLTRATIAINGEDQEAQAEALLHEYMNLQAMDKEGGKIGDRLASIIDMR